MENKRVELLAPAGDEQTAYVALQSGANAIYLGLSRFSARVNAENFDIAALSRVARYAHLLGAKVYVTLNTLVKDSETDEFFRSALAVWEAGADAILVQDIFLGRELKKAYPEITLHLSTQAGCCNVYGARLAKEFGFARVVLARETPLEEIALISREIETEVFVQGALCTCFSGQCYLSSFVGNNSGNRGRCKQPCRKKYSIDRKGFEECAYALSTSDLSLGGRIGELLRAGVSSLKIEGRLRRAEYVEAAVRYYRALLDGENASAAFSQMKRAYNRGDYTEGLGFGQKENFLSRDVQGHIGERVGEISIVDGKYFCKSSYRAVRGDGFKILRDGKEVGGATFKGSADGGFLLSSSARLRAGDEVRLTTSCESVPNEKALHHVRIELRFFAGEPMEARCGDLVLMGAPLARAERAPLTEEDLRDCFCRVDGLPLAPEIEVETRDAFLPKSALNAFRRAFYERLADSFSPVREPLSEREVHCEIVPRKGTRIGLVSPSSRQENLIEGPRMLPDGGHGGGIEGPRMLKGDADRQNLPQVADNYLTARATALQDTGRGNILIDKPTDYSRLTPRADAWLYLPPFLTTAETDDILSRAKGYAGIYGEGFFALAAAKKYNMRFFAGTGFNLTNRFAVKATADAGAEFFALSKELSSAEQRELAAEGAFALSLGDIKVMDLIYCPFSKTCATCDRRTLYTLTDEDGRKFPMRRYEVGGQCRFEVYNCAPLAAYNGGTNALVDCSTGNQGIAVYALAPEQAALGGATKGHANRSMQ